MAHRVISCGMIAGMSMAEVLASAPGFVMDMHTLKVQYDAAIHGLRLKGEEK